MPHKIISAQPYGISQYWRLLVSHTHLIKILAVRELKIKYSRTLLGIGWFFIQPLTVVIVYSLFFKYLVKINSDGLPYPPFVFSGLVLWYLFTGIIGKCTYALIESGELINKVSFPRLIVLISKCAPVVLECFVLLMLLLIIMPAYNLWPGLSALYVIYYFILVVLFSFGSGIFCSIIALKYRDFAHSIPFLVNFGIWLTPVFYPASLIPEPYSAYLRVLNPLFASVEGLRNTLFHHRGPDLLSMLIFVSSCILLLLAFLYFVKFEKRIAEKL